MATRDELTAIRPGAALRLRGDEFVVERCGHFEDQAGGFRPAMHPTASPTAG